MSAQKPVFSVSEILDITLFRTIPARLFVRAGGEVNSSGWSNGVLVPRVYVTPPADCIQEFDFLAAAPSGAVFWALSPILGEGWLEELPDWAIGIRVIAETNAAEGPFPMAAAPLSEADANATSATACEGLQLTASHDKIAPEPLLIESAEGYFGTSPQGAVCFEFQLASLNIPETKTILENRCIANNPFNGECIANAKMPVQYHRTSKLRLMARICVPNGEEAFDQIKDCAQQAVIAGVAIGVVSTGNLAAAAAALKSYLTACLKATAGDAFGYISADLRREKIPGAWKRL
ncbi:hypothetical protein AB838_07785 [Rhodobacteraceae bacterium (ex Bugula neritina AB1)]|nr:hypothetical protein AB838_07785 [Rhodobacteraceae bacterium (ex Bugula neritina AB1)]